MTLFIAFLYYYITKIIEAQLLLHFNYDYRKTAAAPYKSVPTPNPEDIQYNPEVPCVRSNIKLEYKEDRGRYLVANEDIKPGLKISSNGWN